MRCLFPSIFNEFEQHVINGRWCPTCKNKTELMVLNFLEEMNITVVTQYIPGGMKQMKKNYGKFGKLDYHLPNSEFIWELDGAQHNMEVADLEDNTLSPHDFRQMEEILGSKMWNERDSI